ncbi:type IVB secretion system protein IcmH/DotU [Paracoccus sp. S1E-3]|uniref:type IVB secretion system protein IcmH/DotU n=1 Tax=Paracoccus sp. S1E-3 TaxID=2756130 RepID=UPI0015EE96EA|nr:type IVB secretion system protein IcmH/DotU [Paracoccus sp. S1E-3]MBA4492644.1 DotU family type IV/VI secretion system protein [Paracoccus sp. S1E-3]
MAGGRKDDDDRTDLGGRNGFGQGPGQSRPADDPFGQPQSPFPAPPARGDDRTVIGGQLNPPGQQSPYANPYPPAPGQTPGYAPGPGGYPPGGPQPGGYPAPGGYPSGHAPPSGGTWVGAPSAPAQSGSPFPAYPAAPHGAQPGYPGAPVGQAGHGGSASPFDQVGQIGRAPGQGDEGFFPQYHQPDSAPRQTTPRIPLHEALRVRDLGAASSSNPLLAAAAPLLILLGRLRTGLVELQVAPLMEHVTREIERFEQNARAAGVDPHEVLVAKYALSGTADDIVQNLPGGNRGDWQQYSMVARFFHKRDSGVGFFQEVEKALQAPAQRYNLLELMLVCLSLGFEGQFRTAPNGAVQLARYRGAIYESLRRVKPRPDEDISVTWAPVEQGRRRRFGAIPIPAVAGIAAAALLGIFATFSTLINRDGSAVAAEMRALHQGAPTLQIDRTTQIAFVAPETTQLQRVRDAFSPEIADGRVQVEQKGDYIAIRVGNLQLFDTGKVQVKPGFGDLAARIAEVLNSEPGPVLIEGHTDNVPMSGRGQYKDNYQLSQARADSVLGVLAPLMTDASRLEAAGRGEDDPVGDNATDEGRTANRRVDLLLAREGSYEAATDTAEALAAATETPETETPQ